MDVGRDVQLKGPVDAIPDAKLQEHVSHAVVQELRLVHSTVPLIVVAGSYNMASRRL
jgi:hypothetical protein